MWVRGLKRKRVGKLLGLLRVAPHVGAWIETPIFMQDYKRLQVAPHVGAWIETPKIMTTDNVQDCRTPCGCVD